MVFYAQSTIKVYQGETLHGILSIYTSMQLCPCKITWDRANLYMYAASCDITQTDRVYTCIQLCVTLHGIVSVPLHLCVTKRESVYRCCVWHYIGLCQCMYAVWYLLCMGLGQCISSFLSHYHHGTHTHTHTRTRTHTHTHTHTKNHTGTLGLTSTSTLRLKPERIRIRLPRNRS